MSGTKVAWDGGDNAKEGPTGPECIYCNEPLSAYWEPNDPRQPHDCCDHCFDLAIDAHANGPDIRDLYEARIDEQAAEIVRLRSDVARFRAALRRAVDANAAALAKMQKTEG